MALSDCEKCWDTPCRCGHEYRDWSVDALNAQIAMLTKVRDAHVTELESMVASLRADVQRLTERATNAEHAMSVEADLRRAARQRIAELETISNRLTGAVFHIMDAANEELRNGDNSALEYIAKTCDSAITGKYPATDDEVWGL